MVTVEDTYTGGVDVTADVRNTQALLERKLLYAFDEPVAFVLVWAGAPVVSQVIEEFDLAVKVVGETRGQSLCEHDEGVHGARESTFQEDHSRVRREERRVR